MRHTTVPLITSGLHPRVFCRRGGLRVFTTLRSVCHDIGSVSAVALGGRLTTHNGLSTINKPCRLLHVDSGIDSDTRLRCRTLVLERLRAQHVVHAKFRRLLTFDTSRSVSVSSVLIRTRQLLRKLRSRDNMTSRLHSVSQLVSSALTRIRRHVRRKYGNVANVPANFSTLSRIATN